MAEGSRCTAPVDFVFKENSPEIAEIGDPIRVDLKRLNITVREIEVSAEEFIKRELNGDFNIMFTKTWGAPYDPHTYFSSWERPSHVEHSSTKGLKDPMSQKEVLNRINKVLVEQDAAKRDVMYREILDGVHKQAAFLPLYGVRTPYVLNKRLSNFEPGAQTYSYPISSIKVAAGTSDKVTMAPGAGGSLFTQVGRVHPHLYFPNQLFTQDWVYERLVRYGNGGEIQKSLAENWTIDNDGNGWKVVFQLRKGVKFHNGEDWNCAAAKLNFDHVLHPKVKKRHSWFKATDIITEWSCEGDDFVIKTSEPYYPLFQELSYIRPLSFAAPGAFAKGLDSDPVGDNSCHPGEFGAGNEDIEKDITCRGLSKPIGTGPFKYVSKTTQTIDGQEVDTSVIFQRNDDHWESVPEIREVEIVYYDDTEKVKADLVSGKLDMAVGTGPLSANGIKSLDKNHTDVVTVSWSDIQQHAIAVINTAKAPTDDVNFRKAIMYGVDKAEDIIKPEFAQIWLPADQMLPKSLPHCNVDLEPRFTYDPNKAAQSCGFKLDSSDSGSSLGTGAIVGIIIGVVGGILLLLGVLFMRRRRAKKVIEPIVPLGAENIEQGAVFE